MEFQGRLRHRRRWGVWLCGASFLFVSATWIEFRGEGHSQAFRKKPKEPLEAPEEILPVVEVEHIIWSWLKEPQVLAALGIAALLLLSWCRHRSVQASRRLRRPYQLSEDLSSLKDADLASLQKQLESAILWLQEMNDQAKKILRNRLQETVLLPIDRRLPGRPFEFDLAIFPCKPTVLMIGNHSSGKSTFINRMMGVQVQETGVAPTDDGFTILERSEEFEQFEDWTVKFLALVRLVVDMELQRFGRSFLGHCRRKRMVLPKDAELPYGLQLVDTPGMIDLPGNNQTSSKARGYNFVEVVRWWAKRSDLILLLFDPDKPGTTGETLEVLTKSLAGLDHKFLVVLNKVDQLDNNVDFARAFGTLGWALSKVIPQKDDSAEVGEFISEIPQDIPMVWTMYNERNGQRNGSKRPPHENELPLEAFAANRNAVVREGSHQVRHWDNIVTALEECLRQCDMLSRMCNIVRENAKQQICKAWRGAGIMLTVPWVLAAFLVRGDLLMGGAGWQTEDGGSSFMIQAFVLCCLLCLIVLGLTFLVNRLAQERGIHADTLLDMQRQVRLEFKVPISRMTWGCWRYDTSEEEKIELLDAALRHCGVHPRAYASGRDKRWGRVLQSYGIGWHFEHDEAGYCLISGFWDNAGNAVNIFDFDLVDLGGLYYSDTRLGAPVDWKAYLHFMSSSRDFCCGCKTRGCEYCWETNYLVEVASMAGCNAARMMRVLTLLKSTLSLEILALIDSFLTTDI
eukprot:s489_g18.t1